MNRLLTLHHIRQEKSGTFRKLAILQPSLIVVRSGIKFIRTADHVLEAHAGQAIALSAGEVVDVTNRAPRDGPYQAEAFAFDPAFIASGTVARGLRHHGVVVVGKAFGDALQAACTAAEGAANLPHEVARHRVSEVLLWLAAAGIALKPGIDGTLGGRIRSIVAADPQQGWNTRQVLEALAHEGAAMSEATLRRHLASERLSLSAIIQDIRLSTALHLLQTTSRPIGTVAQDVGYESASRFAVRFKARFGMPPSAIRHTRPAVDRTGTKSDRHGIARNTGA